MRHAAALPGRRRRSIVTSPRRAPQPRSGDHPRNPQAACGPDERLTLQIFSVPGLLADQHEGRTNKSFAENGLRGILVEITAAAAGGGTFQGRQVDSLGKKVFSRYHDMCSHAADAPVPRRQMSANDFLGRYGGSNGMEQCWE